MIYTADKGRSDIFSPDLLAVWFSFAKTNIVFCPLSFEAPINRMMNQCASSLFPLPNGISWGQAQAKTQNLVLPFYKRNCSRHAATSVHVRPVICRSGPPPPKPKKRKRAETLRRLLWKTAAVGNNHLTHSVLFVEYRSEHTFTQRNGTHFGQKPLAVREIEYSQLWVASLTENLRMRRFLPPPPSARRNQIVVPNTLHYRWLALFDLRVCEQHTPMNRLNKGQKCNSINY